MEFKFDVSEIFPSSIVEVNQNLIPPGFCGDRRGLSNVVAKVADVINTMGDASATAQGLSNPITTAERLRKADQTVYLLVDRSAKSGKGVVTGMLKTGRKSLYIFDRDGQHYHVSPPCVLDFYIHESRQRQGLGKQLFEHMLQKEKVDPSKLAIDRPSEKLLSFMNKHYGLQNAMRQMNNYVVFDGFFPESENKDREGSGSPFNKEPANGLQSFTSYGRYGARRPPCSMGEIIHNQSPIQSKEPTGGVQAYPQTTYVTQSQPIMSSGQEPYSNQMQVHPNQSAPASWYLQQQQPSFIPPQYQQPNIYQQPIQQYPQQQTYAAPMHSTQQQSPFTNNQYVSPPLPSTPYNPANPAMSAPQLYTATANPYVGQQPLTLPNQLIHAQPQYTQQYQVNVPPQESFMNQGALMQQPSAQITQIPPTTPPHLMMTQQQLPQTVAPSAYAQGPNIVQHQSLPIIPNQQHVVMPAQSLPTLPNQTIPQQQQIQPHLQQSQPQQQQHIQLQQHVQPQQQQQIQPQLQHIHPQQHIQQQQHMLPQQQQQMQPQQQIQQQQIPPQPLQSQPQQQQTESQQQKSPHHRQDLLHSESDALFNDGYPPQRRPNKPPVSTYEPPAHYKYFDSTKETMQTAYTTPNPVPVGNETHVPNATGDMQPQITTEGYQQATTMKQPVIVAQPISNPIQMQSGDYQPPVNVNPNQDQSGQMLGQNVQQQSQLVNRPQIASQ